MFTSIDKKEILQQENTELKKNLADANYLIEIYKKMIDEYKLTIDKLQDRIAKSMPMELKIGAWQTMLEESANIQKNSMEEFERGDKAKYRGNYINEQKNNEDEEFEEES